MYFVYRSHYEGPLSKRVRHLPDASIVDWFRRGWAAGDPEGWVERELGGNVYGLDTIFEAAREHDLPAPDTWQELRDALREHLYVEGDEDYIRVDEHALRVKTDDDEVELAYFFLEDKAVDEAPERLAYLVHPQWPLPASVDGNARPFAPQVAAEPIGSGPGEGATYAVLLTYYDGETIACCPPRVFPGVRLPGLAAHLRSGFPALAADRQCPPELVVLAAHVEAGEESLAPALARCNVWPGFNLDEQPWRDIPGQHDDLLAAQRQAQPALADDRRPDRSLLQVEDHLAQLAMHCNKDFGYQQWYLFDDVWAGTHPDLAQSLLRYAAHWDPYA